MIERPLANSQLGSLEYDPAPESSSIAKLRPNYGLFIDGNFTDSAAHEQFASINPANELVVATVAQASERDVDRAVVSARRAYDKVWSSTTGAERSKYLFRIARIIRLEARTASRAHAGSRRFRGDFARHGPRVDVARRLERQLRAGASAVHPRGSARLRARFRKVKIRAGRTPE